MIRRVLMELDARGLYSRIWLDDVEVTDNVREVVVSATQTATEVVLRLAVERVVIEGDVARVLVTSSPEDAAA